MPAIILRAASLISSFLQKTRTARRAFSLAKETLWSKAQEKDKQEPGLLIAILITALVVIVSLFFPNLAPLALIAI